MSHCEREIAYAPTKYNPDASALNTNLGRDNSNHGLRDAYNAVSKTVNVLVNCMMFNSKVYNCQRIFQSLMCLIFNTGLGFLLDQFSKKTIM